MAQAAHQALVQLARRDALKYRENPNTFVRQIQQESGFDPNARSSAGAEGIAQIVPKYHSGVDPYNPVQALDYAAKYMADLTRKYGGNVAKALSVYNSGSPTAYQDPNFAGGQTYNYVRDILGPSLAAKTNQTVGQAAAPVPPPPAAGAVATPAASAGPSTGLQALLHAVTAGGTPNFLPALTAARTTSRPPQPAASGATTPVGKQTLATGKTAVQYAKQQLGVPYQWGGETAGKGFDCSGLLQAAWATAGIKIPRTTYDQYQAGRPVPANQLQPGDAVFFKGSDSKTVGGKTLPGHVGIYLGGGKIIEAPHTGASVEVSTLAGRSDFMGARRFG